jgi:hypothetical protein
MTVQPLATDPGLKVDTTCNRDDADCAATRVQNCDSEGTGRDILIYWEHDNLSGIMKRWAMIMREFYQSVSLSIWC